MYLRKKTTCIDLNFVLRYWLVFIGGPASEQWTHGVFATHGLLATSSFSPLRETVQRQPEGQGLQVS